MIIGDVIFLQVNFILTQIIALVLAGVLRWKLHPSRVSSQTRNAFGLIFGLSFGYFCFGRYVPNITLFASKFFIKWTNKQCFFQKSTNFTLSNILRWRNLGLWIEHSSTFKTYSFFRKNVVDGSFQNSHWIWNIKNRKCKNWKFISFRFTAMFEKYLLYVILKCKWHWIIKLPCFNYLNCRSNILIDLLIIKTTWLFHFFSLISN